VVIDERRPLEPLVAVGIPVVTGEGGPRPADGVPATIPTSLGSLPIVLDPERSEQRGFTGKVAETMTVVPEAPGPVLVFVGCGAPGSVDGDVLRRAAAVLVRAAGRSGVAAMVLPDAFATASTAQAIAEGAILAAYRYQAQKSEREASRIERLVVALHQEQELEAVTTGIERGARIARAVCWARDLVNEPPSSLTPRVLAEMAARELSASPGTILEQWDEERISAERLGGLLGVARGSAEPPRLLWATYEPADPVEVDGHVPHVVLVGKGITFDSGGLSLKTAGGMTTMKTDMSGAAAVLATISACGDLGVPIKVSAIAPVTENMPGGRAIKPGDVLTIRNGHTIEVLNTDAEGRLILADGLSLATELHPDAIVDLATLTGACVVALGTSIAGLFGTDQSLVGRVQAASERAGERTWPLPLADEYCGHIDSEVADMKNVGKNGQAGAISAALLLARFVGGVPWVHLDIAGPARSDEDNGVLAKGGTGFGVRTLLELLSSWGDQNP
jgi:leucyl aminopeptidase